MIQVSTDVYIHFDFLNLSLARGHLYGGVGIAFGESRVVVATELVSEVRCRHPAAREYTEQAVELLGVEGVDISVERTLPRHAGLDSGTQLALAMLRSITAVIDREADVRRLTPEMGRGGHSEIGIVTLEAGGAALDAGHPTTHFTTDRPEDGS